MDEGIIHRRLVTLSKTLIKELEELGYEKYKTYGSGIKEVTYYVVPDKNKKWVITSYNYLVLVSGYNIDKLKPHEIKHDPKKGIIVHHKGLTVHDEILKFFTKREL